MWYQEWRSQRDLNQHLTSKDTAEHIKFVQENGMSFVLCSGPTKSQNSFVSSVSLVVNWTLTHFPEPSGLG